MAAIPRRDRLEISLTSRMITLRPMAIKATAKTTSTWISFSVRYVLRVETSSIPSKTSRKRPKMSSSSLISSKMIGGVMISLMISRPIQSWREGSLMPSSQSGWLQSSFQISSKMLALVFPPRRLRLIYRVRDPPLNHHF